MHFLPPPSLSTSKISHSELIMAQSIDIEPRNPQLGFQNFGQPMDQSMSLLGVHQVIESRGTKRPNNEGSNGLFGVQRGGIYLNLEGKTVEEEQEEELKSSSVGRNGNKKMCSKGHWRPPEDDKLRELVTHFGPQNWNFIAENLEGRSGKSCRLRWFNQLDPRINRRAFSDQEEERLLAAHRLYGNKWAIIARLFPGRTDNAIKNHWHVIMARKCREQSSIYKRKPITTNSNHNNNNVTTPNPSSQIFPPIKPLDIVQFQANNNCGSESTTLSTSIDESGSTCTDLTLSPSSTKSSPRPFYRFNPQAGPMGFSGSTAEKKLMLGNRDVDRLHVLSKKGSHQAGPIRGVVKGLDQSTSGLSYSNSEVSASESVGTKRANPFLSSDNEVGNHKVTLAFFDFLGVGTAQES